MSSSKTSKLSLVKNKKIDCLYHRESMLVFKSASEKLVIGRIENDEVVPLDEKSLELCQEYGFKYDESLVETEEASHEEPVDEEPSQAAPQPSSQATSQPSSQATSQPSSQTTSQAAPQPSSQATSQAVLQPSSQATSQQTSQETSQPASQAVSQAASQVETNSSEDTKVIFSKFAELLGQSCSTIEKHFQNQINLYAERIVELESQNLNLRKELDDTKKKMRGILAAIQADL